ncbi:MAG: zinc-dependent alcohol dehydrogenase family protein [Pseudomonadales bacterium]|nr:zinc-dependent alcohol dehydrogenase family protein [Halieaceae bacterium]MCP5165619.1 zinc-dependent alcohol dehydrogenase family protein [Pseudomonadales bacterium]MCP5190865.1 zinc-dependent alcohol dehydrogenase family protein [Pseudomonadales bacterium]
MKAVRISHVSDDLSGIELVEMPVPEPGPGLVRVRMLKAAIHPSDLNYISGEYRQAIERLIWNYGESQAAFDPARTKLHPELPCIPGGEGVGIVDACGEGVDADHWMGKRVGLTAGPPGGTWQEYVIAAPQQLSPVPEALSDEQGALMMLNPLTALVMSRHVLKAGEGDWLLMSAGASAVSKQVAALGRHYGFRTISLVRTDSQPDDSQDQLGDVIVNTSHQDLREEVKRVTDGRGVDFVLDCVGSKLAEQMVTCLTDGGKMLLYGTLGGASMELYSRDLMMANATIGGFYMPGWLAAQSLEKLGEVIGELGKLSATGIFTVPIEAQYPVTEVVEAVSASRRPGRTGKILLDFPN